MSPGPEVSESYRDGGGLRLELKPHPPASAYLDGTWWPRSTELAIELPVLLEALSQRLGEVVVVGYHTGGWNPAPLQIEIANNTIRLQGFTSAEPETVILIGRDGRRVALQIVSPGASEAVARHELDAASEAGSTNDEPGRASARSVTEVAAQLARHEGRIDPRRTAQIAQWCDEAAEQFVNAPIQAFVPILVHHIVRNRMSTARPAT